MDTSLAQQAIKLALNGKWEDAIKVNKEILEISPEDVDALNRLARAYAESGNIKKAKSTAHETLEVDPLNAIAQKCLAKWAKLKKIGPETNHSTTLESFLEEPGITKLIQLLNTGDSKVAASLAPGDEVKLTTHSHKVSVVSLENKYIGRLPDDIAARIKKFIKAGYKYKILIKSVEPEEIHVFIRELEKGKGQGAISFSSEKIDYVSFTPPNLVHKDVPDTGEEESE